MLRVIVDPHGSANKDLFVKIDGRPTRVWVADTGWLDFFFNNDNGVIGSDEELIFAKKKDVVSLIWLWQKTLFSDKPVCYLPLELSDQCGAAIQITKGKRLCRITHVWSSDVREGLSSARFSQIEDTIAWQSGIDQGLEWELAPSSIQAGLTWSLAQLEQPVVPLRYD